MIKFGICLPKNLALLCDFFRRLEIRYKPLLDLLSFIIMNLESLKKRSVIEKIRTVHMMSPAKYHFHMEIPKCLLEKSNMMPKMIFSSS